MLSGFVIKILNISYINFGVFKKNLSVLKLKKNVMLLISNLVIIILLGSNIAEVFGSSTIFQCYDETVYMESPTTHEMLALFTIRVGISIQTEPDGTWKENSTYRGEISVTLEWYNSKLFPYGICLEFPKKYVRLLLYIYEPFVNQTIDGLPNSINLT